MFKLEYVSLGWSGLKVSCVAVGGGSFGHDEPWRIELNDARKIVNKALDLGINYFDTSNTYAYGRSEEIIGELLKDCREDVIIATKVRQPMGPKPNQSGLSRKHVMHEVKASLTRLKTDYIDLYQTHRWDNEITHEEALSTLSNLVKQGIVRYLGACSMTAWQFAKALFLSEMKGFDRFVNMQNKYNLLYREEEREMIPLCKDQHIALTPYNPTAVGVLTGAYLKDGKIIVEKTDINRLQPDNAMARIYYKPYVEPIQNAEIVKRVVEIAKSKGVKPAGIAFTWLFHKQVTSIIVGTTKPEHLEEAVESKYIKLTDEEIKYLEEPYRPLPVSW